MHTDDGVPQTKRIRIIEVRFTIPHIGNTRMDYIVNIRDVLSDQWEEVDIPAVNGNDRDQLEAALKRHGNPAINYEAKVGQLGRWLTFLDHTDTLDEGPLFVVEDDAIIDPDFFSVIDDLLYAVPKGADFFSLFIPRNRTREVFVEGRINPVYDIGDEYVVRAHQPYGGVAMVLYPPLKQHIKELIKRDGINKQFDDYLYEQSQMQNLNGFSIVPNMQDLVWIDGGIPSTVHETGFYNG